MGTQGPRTLKPYPLDHTVLATEDPSKASPLTFWERIWRGRLGGSSFYTSSPSHPCLHLPDPFPRSSSLAFSIPFSLYLNPRS